MVCFLHVIYYALCSVTSSAQLGLAAGEIVLRPSESALLADQSQWCSPIRSQSSAICGWIRELTILNLEICSPPGHSIAKGGRGGGDYYGGLGG